MVLWIPTYASELNPIEWVWKLFKDKWHKDMYRRYLAPDAPLNRTETQYEIEQHCDRLLQTLNSGHNKYCKGRLSAMANLAQKMLNEFGNNEE